MRTLSKVLGRDGAFHSGNLVSYGQVGEYHNMTASVPDGVSELHQDPKTVPIGQPNRRSLRSENSW